jgi:hypothetical protein
VVQPHRLVPVLQAGRAPEQFASAMHATQLDTGGGGLQMGVEGLVHEVLFSHPAQAVPWALHVCESEQLSLSPVTQTLHSPSAAVPPVAAVSRQTLQAPTPLPAVVSQRGTAGEQPRSRAPTMAELKQARQAPWLLFAVGRIRGAALVPAFALVGVATSLALAQATIGGRVAGGGRGGAALSNAHEDRVPAHRGRAGIAGARVWLFTAAVRRAPVPR